MDLWGLIKCQGEGSSEKRGKASRDLQKKNDDYEIEGGAGYRFIVRPSSQNSDPPKRKDYWLGERERPYRGHGKRS